MDYFKNKNAYASVAVGAFLLAGCEADRPRVSPGEIAENCEEYCSELRGAPDIYTLVGKAADAQGVLRNSPNDNIYVRTPTGVLKAPNKLEGLEPKCFSKTDFAADFAPAPDPKELRGLPTDKEFAERLGKELGATLPEHYRINYKGGRPDGSLWSTNLTWENTTITFINFNKDGRLESRNLTKKSSTKSGHIRKALDHLLDPGNSTSPVNEHLAVQHVLMALEGPNNTRGRSLYNQIDTEGFTVRNLSNVPVEKTPFYKEFDLNLAPPAGVQQNEGHVFFYVLLDDHLRFNRDAAAMIPYAPRAATDIGSLYAPYIQHPVMPLDPVAEFEKADIMTVQFVQGGSMTQGLPKDAVCAYPYDIGVKAESQVGFKQVTPLMIDPEVKTRGVLPF